MKNKLLDELRYQKQSGENKVLTHIIPSLYET